MSKGYVKAVLDYVSVTSPTDTSVLAALAEYTSDETRLAWPSIAALSRRTRFSRRSVQRALRRLEARGLIATTLGGQDDQGRNTASVYRLEFDHHGIAFVDAKLPPKRALQPAPAPRPMILPPSASATATASHTPSPRGIKKITTVDGQPRDLSAEKQRQLAALRSKLVP